MTIRENFFLGRSDTFNLPANSENQTNLTLSPNPNIFDGFVIGIVLSGGLPVDNALIKVLTPAGDPVAHVFSNANGFFSTPPLNQSVYEVVASAPGLLTSSPVTVNINVPTAVYITINMVTDPRASLNTLYGLVINSGDGARIGNATVGLTTLAGDPVATTLTDDQGQYLLCEIGNGSYQVNAEKAGFQVSAPIPVTVGGSQLSRTNITLASDVDIRATVQGFILDQDSVPIAGACVGLYSVSGGVETMIKVGNTNSNGFYLFGGLDQGQYLVKAKSDTIV